MSEDGTMLHEDEIQGREGHLKRCRSEPSTTLMLFLPDKNVGNKKGPNRRPCCPPEPRLPLFIGPPLGCFADIFMYFIGNERYFCPLQDGGRARPRHRFQFTLEHGSCCGGVALDDHSTDANKRDKREGETDGLGCHRRQARCQALASYRQVREWTPDQWRLPNVFRRWRKIKAPLRYCTSE